MDGHPVGIFVRSQDPDARVGGKMQEKLELVRTRFLRWIEESGISHGDALCEETLLMKDSCLLGYRFVVGNVRAVWIHGETSFEVRAPGRSDTLVPDDENPGIVSRAA